MNRRWIRIPSQIRCIGAIGLSSKYASFDESPGDRAWSITNRRLPAERQQLPHFITLRHDGLHGYQVLRLISERCPSSTVLLTHIDNHMWGRSSRSTRLSLGSTVLVMALMASGGKWTSVWSIRLMRWIAPCSRK